MERGWERHEATSALSATSHQGVEPALKWLKTGENIALIKKQKPSPEARDEKTRELGAAAAARPAKSRPVYRPDDDFIADDELDYDDELEEDEEAMVEEDEEDEEVPLEDDDEDTQLHVRMLKESRVKTSPPRRTTSRKPAPRKDHFTAPAFQRPRGRGPKNKVFNYDTGVWDDAEGEEGSSAVAAAVFPDSCVAMQAPAPALFECERGCGFDDTEIAIVEAHERSCTYAEPSTQQPSHQGGSAVPAGGAMDFLSQIAADPAAFARQLMGGLQSVAVAAAPLAVAPLVLHGPPPPQLPSMSMDLLGMLQDAQRIQSMEQSRLHLASQIEASGRPQHLQPGFAAVAQLMAAQNMAAAAGAAPGPRYEGPSVADLVRRGGFD